MCKIHFVKIHVCTGLRRVFIVCVLIKFDGIGLKRYRVVYFSVTQPHDSELYRIAQHVVTSEVAEHESDARDYRPTNESTSQEAIGCACNAQNNPAHVYPAAIRVRSES